MIKNSLLLIAILCFSTVHAQYDWTPAKVILKNGTSFRGLVKFPKHSGGLISIGTTEFKYKLKKKGKTERYGYETVEEVIFGDEEFATVHYGYVPIQAKKACLIGKSNHWKSKSICKKCFYIPKYIYWLRKHDRIWLLL